MHTYAQRDYGTPEDTHIHICVHTCALMHKGIWTHQEHTHIPTHAHAYICTKELGHTRRYRHTFMHACTHVYKGIQAHGVPRNIYMHTYIHRVSGRYCRIQTQIKAHMHVDTCTKASEDIRGNRHTDLYIHTYAHKHKGIGAQQGTQPQSLACTHIHKDICTKELENIREHGSIHTHAHCIKFQCNTTEAEVYMVI